MLHSSSGRKDEQLRESHTSYKIVESASQPVTCSEIYIKGKHIDEVYKMRNKSRCVYSYLSVVLIWCRFTDRSQEFLTWLIMELHLLIGFDIYVVFKFYSTWLSYT